MMSQRTAAVGTPPTRRRSKVAPDHTDAEFASVEDFAEYLLDDDRCSFSHTELMALVTRTGQPAGQIRQALEGFGFEAILREREKKIRGFNTNSHDRWFGPGSSPTHGTHGTNQIMGLAD